MTIIDKINLFENGPENIQNFNIVFSECPIEGFRLEDEVLIGHPCIPETTREITVSNKTFRHNFRPSVPFIESTDEDMRTETGEWKARKEMGLPYWKDKNGNYVEQRHIWSSQRNTENTVMTEEEMKLKPVHYFLLQYLRGCPKSPSREEMAKRLNISIKTVRSNIREMSDNDIITIGPKGITLTNEWIDD